LKPALLWDGVIPDLRGFQAGCGYAYVQASTEENAGAHAYSGWDICAQRIVVRVILLDGADKPLAADGVNPLAVRIEIHVVARSCDGDSRDLFSSVGIEYHQQRRSAGDDEKPVIVFIERHRVVGFGSVQLP